MFRAAGVGKTSLVVRYIGKMFSHHISPTIGASFFTCKINLDSTKIKLQVQISIYLTIFVLITASRLLGLGHGGTGEVQSDGSNVLQKRKRSSFSLRCHPSAFL